MPKYPFIWSEFWAWRDTLPDVWLVVWGKPTTYRSRHIPGMEAAEREALYGSYTQ